MADVCKDDLIRIQSVLEESLSMLTSQRQDVISRYNCMWMRLNEEMEQRLSVNSQQASSAKALLEKAKQLCQLHSPLREDKDALQLFIRELPDLKLFKPRGHASSVSLDSSTCCDNTVTLDRHHNDRYTARIRVPTYTDATPWVQSVTVLPSQLTCEVIHSSNDDDDSQSLPCVIKRTGPCEFSVSFTATVKGEYLLKVDVGFEPITGSPFTVYVRGQPPVSLIGSLSVPGHMTFDAFDNIIVVEWAGHKVTMVTEGGALIKSFGSRGEGLGQFIHPYGIAITLDQSEVIVSDEHRVQKLTLDGDCIRCMGSIEPGYDHTQFNNPMGVAIQPVTGNIFVADNGNNRIVILDSDLNYIRSIDRVCFHDNRSGHVTMSPCDIAFDSVGSSLYIADSGSHCIMKFSLYNEEVIQIIPATSHDSGLVSHDLLLFPPTSVAIDSDNYIYVTQKGCSHVSIFNGNGLLIDCVGGVTNGCSLLKCPISVAIDSYGNLYISDILTNQIILC